MHDAKCLALFGLHTPWFFPLWTLPAGCASVFIAWLKRWAVIEAFIYCSHPEDLSVKYLWRKANMVQYHLPTKSSSPVILQYWLTCMDTDKKTHVYTCARTHTYTQTYPRGVHDCDRCAATLQWAFQHFWSGQRPAHSFPPSQYLHKHIFQKKVFYINDAWLTLQPCRHKGRLERARSKSLLMDTKHKKINNNVTQREPGAGFHLLPITQACEKRLSCQLHHSLAPQCRACDNYYLLSIVSRHKSH